MSVASSRAFEYLEELPGTGFRRLYKQPSTALAIFRRMLPHLAKAFVMAMLYMSKPLPSTDLDAWQTARLTETGPTGSMLTIRSEREQALSMLNRLHILTVASDPGQPQTLKLTNPFAQSLSRALTGGGDHQSFGVPCEVPDKHQVDLDFLDAFARSQWEGILHYMVGSTGLSGDGAGEGPSQGVTKLLQLGGLVEVKGRRVEITQAGFSFLLQEVNAQIWSLLIFYVKHAKDLNMDDVEVLSFLFMLGSLELGQDYSIATLTATQIQLLDDLGDFGIIYRRKSSSRRFYPTRLATTLTSDSGALRSVRAGFDDAVRATDGRGFVIIETNYRVYAYTSSPLQIAVLSLFTRLSTRYPNMVSGRITRESIRRAIGTGITSDQIISYLSTHAHPQMRKTPPVLPPTVVDQIRLWQIEGERMKATSGFLFKEWGSQAEYERTCRYAEEIGVLVWKSDGKRLFFATRVEQLRAFLKGRSGRTEGGR
ncbi:MAG: RNA polymerase II transcription factor B 52 kDa subunit [Caeruleum heppii]|nr:MAG: RNA polymerase II transcription factor B 52 kDa subunit [Caeruleum heppii]